MTQQEALTILKTGASVFLTGEPGAGKTYTINTYVSYLRSHGIEPAITASTGIAATHIHGMTIHSWSGIGIKKNITPYELETITQQEYIAKRIRGTKVLIIDEISMIDAQTLDAVDSVCRAVKQSDAPFGGIQIVLVGDFFQLPPVSRGEAAQFAFYASAWKAMNPIVCYLTEQHRQADERLIGLLSAIRNNKSITPYMDLLESRRIADDESFDTSETITRLFSHNEQVDTINAQALQTLEDEVTSFTMTSKGSDGLVQTLKKGCLSPEMLYLKRGAVVMCTKNNPIKGFVNGTLGVVVGFASSTKYPIIETTFGERITIEPMEWCVEEMGKVKASITQIPLRLAWAITIHKSQGVTLDRAIIDLRHVFEYGQGYVALSRVRTIHGMYIVGWNNQTFEVHPTILEKNDAFHEKSQHAVSHFSTLDAEALQAVHEHFILRSGGTIAPSRRPKKISRTTAAHSTKSLLLQKKDLLTIASLRNVSYGTILTHLESLAKAKELTWEDIMYLYTPQEKAQCAEIKKAFSACDTELLTPVREYLKHKYSFETLRLAKIAIMLQAE